MSPRTLSDKYNDEVWRVKVLFQFLDEHLGLKSVSQIYVQIIFSLKLFLLFLERRSFFCEIGMTVRILSLYPIIIMKNDENILLKICP